MHTTTNHTHQWSTPVDSQTLENFQYLSIWSQNIASVPVTRITCLATGVEWINYAKYSVFTFEYHTSDLQSWSKLQKQVIWIIIVRIYLYWLVNKQIPVSLVLVILLVTAARGPADCCLLECCLVRPFAPDKSYLEVLLSLRPKIFLTCLFSVHDTRYGIHGMNVIQKYSAVHTRHINLNDR